MVRAAAAAGLFLDAHDVETLESFLDDALSLLLGPPVFQCNF